MWKTDLLVYDSVSFGQLHSCLPKKKLRVLLLQNEMYVLSRLHVLVRSEAFTGSSIGCLAKYIHYHLTLRFYVSRLFGQVGEKI